MPNMDNQFQTLSDILDNETQTEFRAGNHNKSNEIKPTRRRYQSASKEGTKS